MARYQVPQDPREPAGKSAGGKPAEEDRLPIPWRWLGLGLIVTVAGILLAISLVMAFLAREPLPVTPLSPTIIVLTAPPSAPATATPLLLTPTALPTLTPVPTPDVAVPPEELAPGFYASVANTENLGVTIRGGPSTNNVAITVADEGTILFVLDGPAEGNGFLWWQVQLADGTEGWAAGDFLLPAAAP